MAKKKNQKKNSKKTTKARQKASKASPGFAVRGIVPLNYTAIDREIQRLSSLLNQLKSKSRLVRKSLNYLEKEQRRVSRQIGEARRFLNKLKNRGIKALRHLPETAEDLYYQLKGEFSRLSQRLRS